MYDFPVKNKKRADRRSKKFKMREKAEQISRRWYPTYDESFHENWSVKHADNLKNCSCHMCCNRRSVEGKSIQERRNEYKYDLT
jgi:hypothetical protein